MPAASSVAGLGAGDDLLPDTNIWVFATTATAPDHQLALDTLAAVRAAGVRLWTSHQILREYYRSMTRPQRFAAAVPESQAVANVWRIARQCRPALDRPDVLAELMRLAVAVPVNGKQIHDANIVATMRAYGIPNLLTHNVKDFTRFAGLVTVVPLVP
jgi:predicted nucleic acid-binding protein